MKEYIDNDSTKVDPSTLVLVTVISMISDDIYKMTDEVQPLHTAIAEKTEIKNGEQSFTILRNLNSEI